MTLQRKLGYLLFSCALLTTLLITVFVNQTISHQFEQYMYDNQEKRNERLMTYFEDYYQKHGTFDSKAGAELAHEAYMNDYCLVLMDANSRIIWGMSPEEMELKSGEVYEAKTFELKVNNELIGYLEIGQHTPLLLSQEDVSFKQAINQSIMISAMITIIVVGSVSLFISKPLSSPIKKVSEMALRLSQGNFKEEAFKTTKIKELDSLQLSMNGLAQTLRAHEETRKQLVSDVSHELRTPLHVLQTQLEAMIDGILVVNKARLQMLYEEVIRFGKLVSNLEVLKQFEAKTMTVDLKPINLKSFIIKHQSEIQTLLQQKEIQLKLSLEDAHILGDEDQLKQVLINLITNAYKFTPEFGVVHITLITPHHQVQLSVHDNGIGVEKEHLSKLFHRFYRVDPSRHQTEGSGIGLTIVKQIIDLHHGKIEVSSQVGVGTTFIMTFPRLSS